MRFVIDDEEYIDLDDVVKLTGIKQTSLYIKIKYKEFPKPENKIIATPRKRRVWKKSEIDEYLEKTRQS